MDVQTVELPLVAKENIVHLFRECMSRVAEFEKLTDEGYALLCGYQQGLGFLRCPPIKKSDLVEKIFKSNETDCLKSYFGVTARCKNTYDVVENMNKLNDSHSGLLHHLTKAKALVTDLEILEDETVTLIQSASAQCSKDTDSEMDEVVTPTRQKESVLPPSDTRECKASEYALMTCIICSMVKQEYKMQEKIIASLQFNESEELESYCFMWNLHPNFQDDFMTMAKEYS